MDLLVQSPVQGDLQALSHLKLKAIYEYLLSFHIIYILLMRKENLESSRTYQHHTI